MVDRFSHSDGEPVLAMDSAPRAPTAALLSAAQVAKLAAILSMLDADHDGEAEAARLAVNRMLARLGVRWRDIAREVAETIARPPDEAPAKFAAPVPWRQTAARALADPWARTLLTAKELDFLASLLSFKRASDRQLAWLEAIADKLSAGGAP